MLVSIPLCFHHNALQRPQYLHNGHEIVCRPTIEASSECSDQVLQPHPCLELAGIVFLLPTEMKPNKD